MEAVPGISKIEISDQTCGHCTELTQEVETPRPPSPAGSDSLSSLSRRRASSFGSTPEQSASAPPPKSMVIHSHSGRWPELNGIYFLTRDCVTGTPVFKSKRTQICIVWDSERNVWRLLSKPDSGQTLAYMQDGGGPSDWPCDVRGEWFIASNPEEGSDWVPDREMMCEFEGQTIVVSGRSGHNQRLNGVFKEMRVPYGNFPAYFDEKKHMYIYRLQNRPAWVISNRLGPTSRRSRGIIFAEVEEDVPEPFLTNSRWTVCAWGDRPAQVDPSMTVFLASEGGSSGGPATILTVMSSAYPKVSGTYTMQPDRSFNGLAIYSRRTDSPRTSEKDSSEKHVFWNGDRWCIADRVGAASQECHAVSQRREAEHCYPEDSAWAGVQVFPAACELGWAKGQADGELLARLRGRTAGLVKQWNSQSVGDQRWSSG